MNFNEVFDMDPKARQARVMKQLQSMYGAKAKPVASSEQQAGGNAHRAKRNEVEVVVAKLAQQATSFEQFQGLALKQIPDVERYVNLRWAFDTYNGKPGTWNDYKNEPAFKGSNYVGD